uniref:protein AMBP n=1 Tax=Pristiophorus japonicus TaxID=55135 RepID=UPI00398F5B9B
MRTVTVLMLMAFLLGTGAAAPLDPNRHLPLKENFDLSQFLGDWYSLAAGCNCPWFKKAKSQMTINRVTLSANEAMDKMNGSFTYDRNGTCVDMTVEYEIQAIPGVFKYVSPAFNGFRSDIRVAHTNYHEFAFVFYETKKDGNTTISVSLYGRTPMLGKLINENFKEFALEQGISASALVFLTKEFCRLPPDAGPCFGLQSKFHYNHTTMTCEKFNYGGCIGNGNNFASERDCLQTCRTVAACRLPIVFGPCRSIVNLWAFDSIIGKCIPFKYSGCQGNGNKFYTQKECQEYCDAVPEGEDEFLAVQKKV